MTDIELLVALRHLYQFDQLHIGLPGVWQTTAAAEDIILSELRQRGYRQPAVEPGPAMYDLLISWCSAEIERLEGANG